MSRRVNREAHSHPRKGPIVPGFAASPLFNTWCPAVNAIALRGFVCQAGHEGMVCLVLAFIVESLLFFALLLTTK